jgi:aminopeptidase C
VKTTKVQIVNSKKTLKHKQQNNRCPVLKERKGKETNKQQSGNCIFYTCTHTHNKNRIYFKLETNRSDGRSHQPAEEQENE